MKFCPEKVIPNDVLNDIDNDVHEGSSQMFD